MLSGPLNGAKLATIEKLVALIEVMVVHVLLNHALLVADFALSALTSMLFKLIITTDLFATTGLEATVQFDCSDQPQQVLIISQLFHIWARMTAGGASCVLPVPRFDAARAEHSRLALTTVQRILRQECKLLADHALDEVFIILDFFFVSDQLIVLKKF